MSRDSAGISPMAGQWVWASLCAATLLGLVQGTTAGAQTCLGLPSSLTCSAASALHACNQVHGQHAQYLLRAAL